MGTYLSTPVTDKSEESGECLSCPLVPVAWGVVDMQGWRKSMEDAHVAQTDVDVPKHHYPDEKLADAKVFGVFDGHGGPEVANFCQLYLVSVLTQQETWKKQVNGNGPVKVNDPAQRLMPKETDIGQALVTSFHALDRMIDDPSRRYDEDCFFFFSSSCTPLCRLLHALTTSFSIVTLHEYCSSISTN